MDFIFMFFRLIIALIVVIFLMMLSLKLSNKGLDKINGKRYMKVVDKVQLGKDSFIAIVKIGDKGIVMSVNPSKSEILEEISLEEVERIEKEKKESIEDMTKTVDKVVEVLKEKSAVLKKKNLSKRKIKEDKNEKI